MAPHLSAEYGVEDRGTRGDEGITNDINADNAFTPFGPVQEDTGYGIVEVFTYDKRPRTLGELEELQVLCRIPLKNYSY